MRFDYGTDWLLSTPNLQVESIQNEASNDLNQVKDMTEEKESVTSDLSSISNIVDSFVVYRSKQNLISLEHEFNVINENETKMCIISLSETSVIEKDELNIEILSVNQLENLYEVNLTNDE